MDIETVNRGLVPAIEKARAMIMAGEVLVDGQVVIKADTRITKTQVLSLKEKLPYASRGALKIENAFNSFGITPKGLKALDIGISTGGFSDYMLKNGAAHVVGVDVNIQQVDQQLRNNPKLTLIKENARLITPQLIGIEPDIITIDVSFISIARILPALTPFKNARIISLIKPQFEAKPWDVDEGGIVRDPQKRMQTLLHLKQQIEALDFSITGFTSSGIKGRKGNREYFFLLEYRKKASINDTIITDAIKLEL